jgi:outer membrane protein OmpA-like peptidoglycan-associated protein
MLKKRTFPAMILAAAVMAACSSMPNQNALLDEARNDYVAAQNNPNVVKLASSELTSAGVALDQANAAFSERKNEETVNKLAYLAKQKIATTQEIAKRKAAELTVANAGKERDQLRLEQRTAEADKAKMETNVAQHQAADAQAQAADAQRMAAESDAYAKQLEVMLVDLAAKKTERGMVITLNDVLFNVDQAELKPDGVRNVQKLADFMKQYPKRMVLIEGNTDSTGSAAHNLELSNRRAEAVRTTLESMGIPRDRIATRGYGEKYPIAGNDTSANRQLNRRVEIIVSEDNARVAPR